jgi:hypothetical protein
MRFAVRRRAQQLASPRSHGVPRRDVSGRVQVRIAGPGAGDTGDTGEESLASLCTRRPGLPLPLGPPPATGTVDASSTAVALAGVPSWREFGPTLLAPTRGVRETRDRDVSPLLTPPNLADGGRTDAELLSNLTQRFASHEPSADLSYRRLVKRCPAMRATDGVAPVVAAVGHIVPVGSRVDVPVIDASQVPITAGMTGFGGGEGDTVDRLPDDTVGEVHALGARVPGPSMAGIGRHKRPPDAAARCGSSNNMRDPLLDLAMVGGHLDRRARPPVGVLLDCEVPHVAGVRAVLQQRRLLGGRGLQTVAAHVRILASTCDNERGELRFLAGLKAGASAPRIR